MGTKNKKKSSSSTPPTSTPRSGSRSKRQKETKPTDTNNGDNDGNRRVSFTELIQKLVTSMGIKKDLDDMSAGEILKKHPLIRVGKFVFIPYLLYYGYYYIRLQHPEYMSKATGGLINLRPAVYGTNTPRQVLIVATPGSGTVQMSTELRTKLSLEIGHESTDAAWDFTRDGSVSWFHGIRFLTQPKDANEKVKGKCIYCVYTKCLLAHLVFHSVSNSSNSHIYYLIAIAKICNVDDIEKFAEHMGFHPAMYGPPQNKCSYRSKWNECWKSECYMTLLKEWGCAVTDSCEIEFKHNLHQVRNPMHTLESLVMKYCIGGIDGLVSEKFLTYASALFPSHDFSEDSCIEATGTFMAMYLEAMLEARNRGDIDAFYLIEKSSACDVAEAAGLLSDDTTVYAPNYKRISNLCDQDKKIVSPAQQIVEKKLNKVNKDEVKLGWQDLRGGVHGSKRKDGDLTLEGKVKNLFNTFGYDGTEIPLQHKPIAHIEL